MVIRGPARYRGALAALGRDDPDAAMAQLEALRNEVIARVDEILAALEALPAAP